MGDYGDEHRLLLQGIMSHRIIGFKDVIKLIEIAKRRFKDGDMPSSTSAKNELLVRMIRAINKELEVVNMAIVQIYDEDVTPRSPSYVFVNRMDRSEDTNQLTKKAMIDFQPNELEYIKLLVAAIVEDDKRQIAQTVALNLALKVKTKVMKTSEAEIVLDRMVEDKWLKLVRKKEDNDTVRLAPRFVAEMEPYLLEVHDDKLQKCHKCSKLVVRAVICPRCSTHQHLYCLGENSSCISCKEEIEVEDEPIKGKGKAGGSKGVAKGGPKQPVARKRSARGFDSSDDDD